MIEKLISKFGDVGLDGHHSRIRQWTNGIAGHALADIQQEIEV